MSAASLPAAAEAQRDGSWFPFDHRDAVPHCAICGRPSPLDQLICRTSELIDGANATEDAVVPEKQVGSGRCAGLPKLCERAPRSQERQIIHGRSQRKA